MKKKNILNLIKYHAENNDAGFRAEAYEIANDFDKMGDTKLAEYIMALMSDSNTFVPQINDEQMNFLEKIKINMDALWLPDKISNDIMGILNAITHNIGINKFLFQGAPGTGKTEAVKQLGRVSGRDVYMVNFATIIDSKLGQTSKNISALFKEINTIVNPERVLILFDEIDALALDRTNNNDIREMGRATSAMLKGMDYMDDRVVIVATTNLYAHFDKALTRRFDLIVDFNRYEREDLLEIAEDMLNKYLMKFKISNKDIRMFRKIMKLMENIPFPGELQNMIRTAIAFSNPDDGLDYLRRLYYVVTGNQAEDLQKLKEQDFTVREMEVLTKKSKSTIAREIKE